MKIRLFEAGNSLRKLPQNLVDEDKKLFIHEENYFYKNTYLFEKNNVNIFNGILISLPLFRYFKKYTFFGDKTFIQRIKRIAKNYIISKSSKTIYIEKGLWFTDHKSHVYFHWLLDSLQRAEASHDYHDKYPLLVREDFYKKEFVRESLDFLKFNFIVLKENQKYKIKNLRIVSKTAKTGNYNEEILSSLIKRFKDSSRKNEIKNGKNLFVLRTPNLPRSILNNLELNDLLKKYNFEFVQFEKLDFNEKIEILNNCKNLVGVFGSGLTNILFMNQNTNLIEIRERGDSHNNAFFSLSSALKVNYYYSFFSYSNNQCLVDIESLEKIFKTIFD